MVGIYIIKNKVNGKVYVGQSWNLKSRISDHKRFLAKGTGDNIHLQYAYNKYGKENFEFSILANMQYLENIDKKEAQKILDEAEVFWINYFGGSNSNNTYNIREGGYGGTYSEEHCKQMSEARKGMFAGELNPMFGKHHTKQSKQLISVNRQGIEPWNKGIPQSQITKDKISKANKGRVQTEAEKLKRSSSIRNLMSNPDYIAKMKDAHIRAGKNNRKYTDEFVKKLRCEHDSGVSIKKLSIKYSIPFESCRVMIKGIGCYAEI